MVEFKPKISDVSVDGKSVSTKFSLKTPTITLYRESEFERIWVDVTITGNKPGTAVVTLRPKNLTHPSKEAQTQTKSVKYEATPKTVKFGFYQEFDETLEILITVDNEQGEFCDSVKFDLKCEKKEEEKTKPSVITVYSEDITSNSAKLKGELTDTGGLSCNVWFEYGKSKESPKKTRKTSFSSTQTSSVTLSNLESNQTYYFRAVASNDKGTVYGGWQSFTTEEKVKPEKTKPSVTTVGSEDVTATSAKVVGELTDTGNLQCTVWFEYGKSKTKLTSTRTNSMTSTGKFSVTLSNLDQNQTYYYRAVAYNDKGTVYGDWQSFTTEEKVKPEPAFFRITKIDIPSVVKVGESFTIKATVKNTGEESGTQDIIFLVDGTEVSSESLKLSGGKTDTVSCTHTLDTMGDHSIKVSSDDDSLTVTVTGKTVTPSLIDQLANLLGVSPEQARTYAMAAGGVLAVIIILSVLK